MKLGGCFLRSLFAVSASETTTHLSRTRKAALSSLPNAAARYARASAVESAVTTSWLGGSLSCHVSSFCAFSLIASTKSASVRLGSLQSAHQSIQHSSNDLAPTLSLFNSWLSQVCAGIDCSSHCSRSLASYARTFLNSASSRFFFLPLRFPMPPSGCGEYECRFQTLIFG